MQLAAPAALHVMLVQPARVTYPTMLDVVPLYVHTQTMLEVVNALYGTNTLEPDSETGKRGGEGCKRPELCERRKRSGMNGTQLSMRKNGDRRSVRIVQFCASWR